MTVTGTPNTLSISGSDSSMADNDSLVLEEMLHDEMSSDSSMADNDINSPYIAIGNNMFRFLYGR